ncbi:hypothetical protein Tco_1196961 [Tanacetum coccineum]
MMNILESCNSIGDEFDNNSDVDLSIWRIDPVNTSYSEAQETEGTNRVKNKHLYLASVIEIDEKEPELKDFPSHLEYAYLHGNKSFPIVIPSKLSEEEKNSLLQVLEKRKGAEDLAADHLSRLENPHMEMLTKREIAHKFPDKHLMLLKSKFNNDEPWYADFVNYIVGKEEVEETMAETMKQYMSKTRADYGSGVARPKIEDKDNFELKGQFLKELRTNNFSGLDHEDANEHIEKVLKIVDLFHIPNITIDQVMLRAFPMSLTGASCRWLRNKPSGSITTWEDLKIKFLSKYCPPARTAKKMEEIKNFQQEPDENLYQA